MRIKGCDLHARQQPVAMLDTETGEVVNLMLKHEGDKVREFYSQLPQPVLVGFMRRLGRHSSSNYRGSDNRCGIISGENH